MGSFGALRRFFAGRSYRLRRWRATCPHFAWPSGEYGARDSGEYGRSLPSPPRTFLGRFFCTFSALAGPLVVPAGLVGGRVAGGAWRGWVVVCVYEQCGEWLCRLVQAGCGKEGRIGCAPEALRPPLPRCPTCRRSVTRPGLPGRVESVFAGRRATVTCRCVNTGQFLLPKFRLCAAG